MKNFTKLFMIAIAMTMATNGLYAQKIGIKAGFNLSNMLIEDEIYSNDFKMKPGFHLGAIVDIPLNDMFSIETGLLLSTKGFKLSEEETEMGETFKYEFKYNLIYLDIPLTAKASFNVGDAKIYGAFGPYIGIGLSGTVKSELSFAGETESDSEIIDWGSDENNDELKRLDYGLTMGVGVEINSIQIGITYGLGLANISPYVEYDSKINNRVLGISVGYFFGGN